MLTLSGICVIQIDLELNTCGLNCPLPLLRLKKALQTLSSGQVVRVLATDPAAVLDFGVFLEQAGHALLERFQTNGVLTFVIRKERSTASPLTTLRSSENGQDSEYGYD